MNARDNHQYDLPEEIETLYHDQLIQQKDIAPMTQLRDELIQSAPQPRDDFQAQLSQRLQSEFRQPKRSIIQRLTPKRLTTRVAILVALLVIGVGTVLAVSTLIQQFSNFDAGLKAVFEQGRGHEIYGVSQTIEDYTVSVEWAYADGNRLIVAFMIQGKTGEQYTNLHSDVHLLSLQSDGTNLPLQQGMTALIDQNGDVIGLDDPTILTISDRSLSIFTYDLSGIQDRGLNSLDLQLEVKAAALTVLQRTQTPEQFDWTVITPEEHFFLNFSVPLTNDQRMLNTPVTATDQNVTITLQQVSVSPSQTRLVVCFAPPDPARQWTAIPRLTTANGEVPGGGGVNPFIDGELACSDYSYQAGMYDYTGEWQLEITELVGFGSGGGNDQQRTAGSWKFAFTVP